MSEKADAINAAIIELEAKRSLIEKALESLRNLQAIGPFAAADGMAVTPLTSPGMAGEIPDGAFHAKSMPAAIKLFLELMHGKKTAREISDGLRRGGLESTSKFFDKIVYSTLDRLRKSGEVVKVQNAWGLPAWYPALMRAGVTENNRPVKRRRGRPRKAESGAPKPLPKQSGDGVREPKHGTKSEPSPMDMVDWFLRDNPGPHTAEEIQSQAGIKHLKVTKMFLGKLIKRGSVEKTENGTYRKAR
jgi:hypothetical protein